MKKLQISLTKKYSRLIVVVLTVSIAGFSLMLSSYAASGTLSLSPSSGSYNVGDNFNVDVVENGASATTIQADIQFPSSLQFVGDTTVAPFSFNPAGTDSASNGSVTVTRSYLGSAASGTVTTLTFKVVSAGSATVSFAASPNSYILPSGCASASCSVLTSSPSSTYTLSQPSSSPPPSNPTPPPSSPGSSPVPAPTPTSGSKGTSISVATTGNGNSSSGQSTNNSSGSSVTVPDNGSVAVNSPSVSVEPSTVQTTGINKVEYFIGNKLVDTETKAPYKYNINTKNLKNGTYKLVSKTFYTDGITKQASQNLIIHNTASKLGLTWLYILIIVLVAIFIFFAFIRRRLLGTIDLHPPSSNPPQSHIGPTFTPTPPTISKSDNSPTVIHPTGEPQVKPLDNGPLGSTPGPGSVIGPSAHHS